MNYYDQVAEAAALLKARLGSLAPTVGIVLGSGLGAAADAVADPVIVPYGADPALPAIHSRRPFRPHGRRAPWRPPVVIMQGRVHFYEGYTPLAGHLSHACSGSTGQFALGSSPMPPAAFWPGYRLGQLVALADHINYDGLESAHRTQ